MKEYYIIVRITYVDFLEYSRQTCKIKRVFTESQKNMFNAVHAILCTFYAKHEDSDIISIEVIENKLY